MQRRELIRLGAGLGAASLANVLASASEQAPALPADKPGTNREPVLVRAGMSRKADGTEAPHPYQHELVRSFDSEGRLTALVLPVDAYPHNVYQGAPRHVHHENDEWIYILEGEFVAEVGEKRIRLKKGDSLLMPMKTPHRWSVAGLPTVGVIHLYTPAGKMDLFFDDPTGPQPAHPTLEDRKAEFERHGITLLGPPLTREEIDATA
jgi:mannose-6-phosphate isomerase-like protein (cupin superfamily)